jgi:haloalkane dehalogenase
MTINNSLISSHYVDLGDLNLHYLSAGEGAPLVLLHGWPTSAYLWRRMMEPLAKGRWVIAPDLAGFGRSDKPLNVFYSANYHVKTLSAFFEKLKIKQLDLVVHDLGGPIGLLWAVRNPEKIRRLVILNTVIYPEVSIWVKLFFLAARLPGIKRWMVSLSGIATFMRLGVANKAMPTKEVIAAYQAPFTTPEARRALHKTITDINPRGLKEVAGALPEIKVPIRIIYGEKDRLIPNVTTDLLRFKEERPDVLLTALPDCGHFLQEDQPGPLSELLLDFLSAEDDCVKADTSHLS